MAVYTPMGGKQLYQNQLIAVKDALLQARNMARSSQQCIEVTTSDQQVVAKAYSTAVCTSPFPAADLSKTATFDFDASIKILGFFDMAGVPFTPFIFGKDGGTAAQSQLRVESLTGQKDTFVILPILGQVRKL